MRQRASRPVEIDNREERFMTGRTEILQTRPLLLKATRAAFKVREKHARLNVARLRPVLDLPGWI